MAYAQKLMQTRWGMTLVAGLAAALAGVLVLVYVQRYRDSVKSEGAPVTVLVARQTIPKGTAGAVIATQGYYTATTIRQSQLANGALSDAANLRDKVATHDIYPGAQLTSGDFAAGSANVASTLTERQRAISLPFDSAHANLDDLQIGDHVDIYAGFNVIPLAANGTPISGAQPRAVIRMIMPNIAVLDISKKSGSGSANVGLKVTDAQAANLAFASDNGKLWLAIRPATGAKASPPNIVTLETLLLGVPPVTILNSLGGRR
jgi:Flp pilus assembly protein CpaB